jgi:glutamyl-tRNA synthetase
MKLLVKMKIWPLHQSERKDLYQQYAVELINSEMRIMLLIQPEALDETRKLEEEQGKTFYLQSYQQRKTGYFVSDFCRRNC